MLPASVIKRSFSNLKPSNTWAFKNAGRSETNAYTHSYHRYPAKFIPPLVQKLIKDYTSEGDVVCDPFGGCGTTLVEAKLLGRNSIGVDINPIAKLITQAKLTPINPKLLEREITKLFHTYQKAKVSTKKNRHERIKYWFSDESLEELDKLYFAIRKVKNQSVKRFFLCAFSHNLKNSSRWLMKSIKPTVDKGKEPERPFSSFKRHVASMQRSNDLFFERLKKEQRLGVSAKMYRKDATKTLPIDTRSVDLIVTSPPYVTSYEYADLHQLSLLWFGSDKRNFKHWSRFISDFDDFRKEFIGTSYKDKKRDYFGSNIANNIVAELSEVDKSLARDVANYFFDMKKAFKEMHRVLKRKKKICVIIGNTKLRGVDILNAEVAAEQMQAMGFKKVRFIKREVINKAITPWRDVSTGKFTSKKNRSKTMAYQYEYLVIMQKS